MKHRARFTFGASEFTTELSAPPWNPMDETLGGIRWTATGVPGPFLKRRDALVSVRLLIEESEWLDYLAFLEFAQSQQPVMWNPEVEEDAEFEVYLDAPAYGEAWAPVEHPGYPRAWDVELTLRGVGLVIPWQPYFVDA